MKILNLYAGIGGNRKNWDGEKHDITAVEKNSEIARVYQDKFPRDEVVIGDAHEYLRKNFQEFDFIWSSPPCPTHSSIRKAGAKNGQYEVKYPDMKLWQEILLLEKYFEGDWVVENVKPFYDKEVEWELVEPKETANHYYWSNFEIPEVDPGEARINNGNVKHWQEHYGFDLSDYSFESVEKRKVLRNCIHPKVGEAILKTRNTKQMKLDFQ